MRECLEAAELLAWNMKKALVALASLFAFLTVPARGCSTVGCIGSGIEMRRDFIVRVAHDGKPLAGVSVQITGGAQEKSAKLFSDVTAGDGLVRVTKLRPGEYWLKAEVLGISVAEQCFRIGDRTSRKAKGKLKFDWEDDAPATRELAGRLIDSQAGKDGNPLWNLTHRIDIPIAGARLRLQNVVSGAAFSTASDQDGAFRFDAVPTGTYVLHIEGGKSDRDYDGTDLAIKVSPSAHRNTLQLSRRDAGGGSCGGTYLELRDAH
jgi:hypothetical protein